MAGRDVASSSGRRTSRQAWPRGGSHRALLEFLDQVREDNGRKSLREIAQAMHLSSATRVNDILRGRRPPVHGKQVMDLVRALGGGVDEAEQALQLFLAWRNSSGPSARDFDSWP